MSITDELREYVSHYSVAGSTKDKLLTAIADRIDSEHQKAIRELNNLADASVLLPVDADGVPIHVWDHLTDGEYTFTVCELAAFGDGSWSIRNEDGNAWAACDVTHYHEPTVEDVLGEFFEEVGDGLHTLEAVDTQVIIAKYAAKLRLAGES